MLLTNGRGEFSFIIIIIIINLLSAIRNYYITISSSLFFRFAFKVTSNNVTLYFNCHEYDSVQIKKSPSELIFDSASTLYVGQAGPLLKGSFNVRNLLPYNNNNNDNKTFYLFIYLNKRLCIFCKGFVTRIKTLW